MGIDWFRDLVICVAGIVFTGVLIFVSVIVYRLYKRTKTTLDSAEAIMTTIQGVSSYVQYEVAKPMVQAVAIIQGIRQGIGTINTIFKKHRGGE